jgi:hypothetical protein
MGAGKGVEMAQISSDRINGVAGSALAATLLCSVHSTTSLVARTITGATGSGAIGLIASIAVSTGSAGGSCTMGAGSGVSDEEMLLAISDTFPRQVGRGINAMKLACKTGRVDIPEGLSAASGPTQRTTGSGQGGSGSGAGGGDGAAAITAGAAIENTGAENFGAFWAVPIFGGWSVSAGISGAGLLGKCRGGKS